jgi:phage FluMu protein Com
MNREIKCPKCGSENVGVELTDARINQDVHIDPETQEIEYSNEEVMDAKETFFCKHCNFLSLSVQDFIKYSLTTPPNIR